MAKLTLDVDENATPAEKKAALKAHLADWWLEADRRGQAIQQQNAAAHLASFGNDAE